ncbi:mannanase [Corallococcus sp. CA054B]|uniref:glycosyl hydrolase n=1 Tax=Corallococcus sp. CA054B TaxID=2316734 RepID=UPI000EA2502E|nr:glycosyl hydrolase [Corallococcus sp. CA054B]RKG69648.1 mannanase [Corallococcus sp. CA054B]
MTHVPLKPSLFCLLAALVLCLGASRASAQVSRTLSTPGPTAQAQKVYNLLTDLENNSRNGGTKQTIMGQHCEAQKEAYAGEYWVKVGDISGRRPGFVEFDFGPGNYRNTYAEAYVDYAVGFARDRFSYGEGIVGFSFHMSYPGAPVKSWPNNFRQSWMDSNWFGRVINWQANTAEYQALLRDLSFAADKLAYLQQQGVPVLYRPFHEMDKKGSASPFWWANQDPAQYKQLWNITHDYTGLAGYNKPRMLAETDKLPVRWGDSRYGTVSELDARPWAIYSIWGDSLVYNLGTTSPNDWNVSSNYKAIKDTYGYYSTYWRVLTGGSNATYNWGALR